MDLLMWFIHGLTIFFTLLIFALVLVFVVKYRRVPGRQPQPVATNNFVEITWTLIPLLIVLVIFAWGAAMFVHLKRAPADAMDLTVVGKQWMWKIQHPEGRREINELHVPLGRDIKLTMTSQDVIHDFSIPAFRVKQDVVPGRYTSEWFRPTVVGEYHLFCVQYCGMEHSHMIGKVTVMEPAAYQAWLNGSGADMAPSLAGAQIYMQYQCATCHGVRAPSLAGLYGSQVLLDDGSKVLADDSYIRESILYPSAKIVAGYRPLMPTFKGQLTEEQVMQLVAYIKSLKDAASAPAQVQPPAEAPTARTTDPGPADGIKK
jgi:cytochrome c oxidase subunit II